MNRQKRRISKAKVALLLGIAVCARLSVAAQEKSKANVSAPPATPITAGQDTFRAYCASCHGLDGEGDGPAAPALKNKPTDLTQLSKRYGGKFPSAMVESAIQGDQFTLAHGSREMPVWGEAFRTTNRDKALVAIKVHNLTLYIESIQQKVIIQDVP